MALFRGEKLYPAAGGPLPTVDAVTDSTAGTVGTTLAALTGTTYASDVAGIRNTISTLASQQNAIIVALQNAGVVVK